MSELSQIFTAACLARDRREPVWIATVMRVLGSAYRHPGARLLFSSGRVLAGSVSGGCLEAGIVRKGPWQARERPVCVRFDGASEQDEGEEDSPRGTGCDGIVDILLESVRFDTPFEPLVLIGDCLAAQRRAALVTVFESREPSLPVGTRLALSEGGALSSSILDDEVLSLLADAAENALREPSSRSQSVSAEEFEALLEIIEPAPRLFVFGSGPDALPVVDFACALGLEVTVCDVSARFGVRERFSPKAELYVGSVESVLPQIQSCRSAAAVVMFHDYPTDRSALSMLLASSVGYIGMLGPKRRTERMLSELFAGSSQRAELDLSRLHAPVGLDLGAETPQQIALSIIAELQSVLGRASAQPLSRRGAGPIHALQPSLALPTPLALGRTGTS